jgi:hypothetical protein
MTLLTLGGVWLDGKVEKVRPLFTVLGAVAGMAAAMTNLVLEVARSERKKGK